MLIYVVKSGDTLYNISNNYKVSMDKLIEINGLEYPNKLVIGQSLLIPTNYNIHQIQKGETIWSIAKQYGVNLQDLIKVNKIIDPNKIYVDAGIIIPNKQKKEISVNAYTYFLGEEAIPIIQEVGKQLTLLSPFAYLIKEDGELQSINDEHAIKTSLEENIIPMMSIINFTLNFKGENLVHIVLSSPEVINNLLNNIVKTMKEKNYKGLNIDFENVLPDDRELYNDFLEKATLYMHSQGYFVSTALAPKISKDQKGTLYEAHDYEAHGQIVDFVILMTYEWGWRKGPPQAISPINEMKRVLDYAVTAISRGKIYMGFQIYARDWLLPHKWGQEAETFSTQEAISRAVKYGAEIFYDKLAQSPHFQYKDEQNRMHEVWFEDARSAQAKFDLVKKYNLMGISYWALGYPFPQNWVLLQDNFNILKQ